MSNMKVRFLTDSASDLPESDAAEYGVKVLPIPITVDGRGYLERVDFTNTEFYDILKKSVEIPATAHITQLTYFEEYEKAAAQGYDAVIVTTISSTGSSMRDAATMARGLFYEEHAGSKMEIYVSDSLNYTMSYGYAMLEAVKMVRAGATAKQAFEYLEDYFTRVEILFTPYTLEYARKSGRIGVAAAFVGEVLGLRPVISIIDGKMKIEDKVRGDNAVITRTVEMVKARKAEPKSPYLIVHGSKEGVGEECAKALTKALGYPPTGIYYIGACIAINSGPEVVGVVFQGKKRR